MDDFFDTPEWKPPHVVASDLSGWIWTPGLRGVEFVTGVDRLSDGTLVWYLDACYGEDDPPIHTRRPLFASQKEALQALVEKFDRSIARRVAIRNSLARKLEATEGGEA